MSTLDDLTNLVAKAEAQEIRKRLDKIDTNEAALTEQLQGILDSMDTMQEALSALVDVLKELNAQAKALEDLIDAEVN